MRGKVKNSNDISMSERITPAYAGKRNRLHLRGNFHGDHPRLCGEKQSISQMRLIFSGSPPPMRGKVSFGVVEDILDRITPAYAGKRPTFSPMPVNTPDHPRLCGEKATRQQRKVKKIGSPPPMRGKASPDNGKRL